MTFKSSVVFADDDPLIGRVVVDLLTSRSIRTTHVLDGQKAIELLQKETPSLVITDLKMPNVDGHELTKYVVENHSNVPVIVLTSTGTEKDAVACFRYGAADYIRKETLQAELIPVVEKLLSEEPALEKSASIPSPLPPPPPLPPLPRERPAPEEGGNHPLASEYRVLRWGNTISNNRWEGMADRELSEQKLRVLRRQVERLEKWVEVAASSRRHPRHTFANIVYLLPLDKDGIPCVERRIAVFCRDISEGGCSVMLNRLLREKDWAVFFPSLQPLRQGPCCFITTVRRDRVIPMGLYEIGMQFVQEHKLASDDITLMSAKRR